MKKKILIIIATVMTVCILATMFVGCSQTEEEFYSRLEGQIKALKASEHVVGFCYTQLYDVEQEINGLFTYDRKKKFSDESYEMIRKAIEEYKEEKGR